MNFNQDERESPRVHENRPSIIYSECTATCWRSQGGDGALSTDPGSYILIYKLHANVCQVVALFETFYMPGPTDGVCKDAKFIITSKNKTLHSSCGYMSGHSSN